MRGYWNSMKAKKRNVSYSRLRAATTGQQKSKEESDNHQKTF